jgi:hypothetical protein
LDVYLYGCETSSLTEGEQHELSVFESTVLGGGEFERKEEEVAGGWGKLLTEELHSVKKSKIIPVTGRGDA